MSTRTVWSRLLIGHLGLVFSPNVHLRHNSGMPVFSCVARGSLGRSNSAYVVYTDESKFLGFASDVFFFVSAVEFEKVLIHDTQSHVPSLTRWCGVACYILSICFGVPEGETVEQADYCSIHCANTKKVACYSSRIMMSIGL